ncbi:nitrite reductase/ring-hydroxylating ferredoxin subunit [Dysgonomonas sp. PH5-45]|uniref:hypothetical protein n=1 Tax=unclassified Dysgonomonas TaxID=2630389 RepID=UPI002475B4ED|nr:MULTISPECIES: hypothetical protein [unclassified Dysgonomonas]MDH6355489.1 nitrite reductase/ring-hydroxylating ferredoxin subunit [Dysgonomonas sp. PH5-45]MDH6388385.1 nitrite reductase/ring-hydroxylating ferredoxin subunit [Dysgonomonas sp. PH5-37]
MKKLTFLLLVCAFALTGCSDGDDSFTVHENDLVRAGVEGLYRKKMVMENGEWVQKGYNLLIPRTGEKTIVACDSKCTNKESQKHNPIYYENSYLNYSGGSAINCYVCGASYQMHTGKPYSDSYKPLTMWKASYNAENKTYTITK